MSNDERSDVPKNELVVQEAVRILQEGEDEKYVRELAQDALGSEQSLRNLVRAALARARYSRAMKLQDFADNVLNRLTKKDRLESASISDLLDILEYIEDATDRAEEEGRRVEEDMDVHPRPDRRFGDFHFHDHRGNGADGPSRLSSQGRSNIRSLFEGIKDMLEGGSDEEPQGREINPDEE